MKTTDNFLLQGLLLSLTTQLALSLVADNASQRSPSAASASQGIVGTLYRSAAIKANPEKETNLAQSARGQRCVRCGTSGYYGGNSGYTADRYYDDYYYRDRAPAYYGREDPYRDPYYAQNRNWYYQPDYRQDYRQDYYRNPYDSKSSAGGQDDYLKDYSLRSYNRYDERYYGREEQPYYNRDPAYSTDTRYNSNYNSYRGNGYDNLNPTYYEAMRDRFQRDRSYGYDQYYDRFYDRPGYRAGGVGGYYDNRNYRPYDETYRGSAGFDNSGRGYYFAGQQGQRPQHPPPPPPPHRPPYSQQPDPYDQAQRPPSTHLNHYNPPQSQSQHTTTRVPPEFYKGKPAQAPQVQTVSSGAIGTIDSNSTMSNKNSNKEIEDKEKISSTYGRPTLGSSYLFDRSNDDDANTGSGMNLPIAGDDKKQESANMEMKTE